MKEYLIKVKGRGFVKKIIDEKNICEFTKHIDLANVFRDERAYELVNKNYKGICRKIYVNKIKEIYPRNKIEFVKRIERAIMHRYPPCEYLGKIYCNNNCDDCPFKDVETLMLTYPFFWHRTVKNAVYLFMKLQNQEYPFNLYDLISFVRKIVDKPLITDSTITRELRELRQDNRINYSIEHNVTKYIKLK